ncbi:MAG: hypothetical protein U0235_03265 [Polyangiaceae bacterium]
MRGREASIFGAAYAILLVAFLWPLFATPVLPGLDLPFHRAIADMLDKAGDPASPYSAFYVPRLWPAPPALSWIFVAVAAKVSSPFAIHIVVGLYVAALPLAVAAYARALGGSMLAGLVAFPLAYNLGLHYGFLGYALSLPALFAMLALATRAARSERGLGTSAAILAGAACVLYGLHLETYVLGLAVAVATAALAGGPQRARAWTIASLAPSMVLAAAWNVATPYASGPPQRGVIVLLAALVSTRRAELAAQGTLTDLQRHLEGIPIHLLRGFRDGLDVQASYALLALLAVWAGFAVARARGRAVCARDVALRAALPLGAFAAYFLLPHHFDDFEAMSISPRLVPLFVLALVATIPAPMPDAGRDGLTALHIVTAAGLLAYGIILHSRYGAFGDELADLVAVIREVPPGERVVGLLDGAESRVMKVDSVLLSIPSSYVALRAGPGSMVPLRYCGMRHVPCSLTARAATLPSTNPWAPSAFDARAAGNVLTVAITDRPLVAGALAGRPARVIAQRGHYRAVRFE